MPTLKNAKFISFYNGSFKFKTQPERDTGDRLLWDGRLIPHTTVMKHGWRIGGVASYLNYGGSSQGLS